MDKNCKINDDTTEDRTCSPRRELVSSEQEWRPLWRERFERSQPYPRLINLPPVFELFGVTRGLSANVTTSTTTTTLAPTYDPLCAHCQQPCLADEDDEGNAVCRDGALDLTYHHAGTPQTVFSALTVDVREPSKAKTSATFLPPQHVWLASLGFSLPMGDSVPSTGGSAQTMRQILGARGIPYGAASHEYITTLKDLQMIAGGTRGRLVYVNLTNVTGQSLPSDIASLSSLSALHPNLNLSTLCDPDKHVIYSVGTELVVAPYSHIPLSPSR